MDVTVQQLRMLCAVARHGTIAAAAGHLGYSPSAVSQQLAALERTLGRDVMERVGRNVRLTDVGRVLVARGDDVLERLEAALVEVEQVDQEVAGDITLTVYDSIASTVLADALTSLRDRHPSLRVRTRHREPDAAVEELRRGEVDLAFTIGYSTAPSDAADDVVRWEFAVDPFHVAVPETWPPTGPTMQLATIAGAPLIVSPLASSCGRCVRDACRAAGFEPDVLHEVDDYRTSLALVAGGHGVALVPELGLGEVPRGVRTAVVDPSVTRSIQLAVRASSASRPALLAIRATFGPLLQDRTRRPPRGDLLTPRTSADARSSNGHPT